MATVTVVGLLAGTKARETDRARQRRRQAAFPSVLIGCVVGWRYVQDRVRAPVSSARPVSGSSVRTGGATAQLPLSFHEISRCPRALRSRAAVQATEGFPPLAPSSQSCAALSWPTSLRPFRSTTSAEDQSSLKFLGDGDVELPDVLGGAIDLGRAVMCPQYDLRPQFRVGDRNTVGKIRRRKLLDQRTNNDAAPAGIDDQLRLKRGMNLKEMAPAGSPG